MFEYFTLAQLSSHESTLLYVNCKCHIFQVCGAVADCTFSELCERALWTNDYAKMTQIFHTVFIRDIPIMNLKTKSEARRFITLIDTLYDHKIRVVASGAADYWDLFQVRPQCNCNSIPYIFRGVAYIVLKFLIFHLLELREHTLDFQDAQLGGYFVFQLQTSAKTWVCS